MNICRNAGVAGMQDGALAVHALVHVAADVGDEQDAVHGRHAEQENETDGGRDAEVEAGDVKAEDAAGYGKGMPESASRLSRTELNRL
jgi:hypothetical protein